MFSFLSNPTRIPRFATNPYLRLIATEHGGHLGFFRGSGAALLGG